MRIHYAVGWAHGRSECGVGGKLTRTWNKVSCRRCWHMPQYLKVATGRGQDEK